MYREKLTQYIDNKQSEMLKNLADFIQIPSISENKNQVSEALNYALNLGKSLGFKVSLVLDGQVGVIEMGGGQETLGILSHVDVVAPGDMDKWMTPLLRLLSNRAISMEEAPLMIRGPSLLLYMP
ncbi:M20 family metallopeptidase [Aminipila terrae]|uniref:M20/M25/M40 family metallo-hydrolase n=1 Tax=Aminipila terrae TaxID=2697030 RepID=A0A6P1MJM2_9FIRM|nr:M20 family metallopeptidase [Aminipila terrae]QHI72218.1 hypothetical protein Ami3637_07220 [Aminipila terrae]